MLVTLLKRWDKTPQLVSISNTSHSGLLNLQLRADTAITAFLKAHTGLEFTNLWGIIFNSWENLKKKRVRKWDLATPAMYSASYAESFVRTSAVCLSVCLCFLCSDACHVTLPFALDEHCQHYIPVWIWFVTWSSHFPCARFCIPSPRLSVIK